MPVVYFKTKLPLVKEKKRNNTSQQCNLSCTEFGQGFVKSYTYQGAEFLAMSMRLNLTMPC